MSAIVRLGLAAALGSSVVAAQTTQAPPQRPGATFRTSINLVPVDVRVVDNNGKPVTHLKASDFKVEEDGVPQAIQTFSTQAFTADAGAVLPEPVFRRPETEAPQPRNRRVFLVVLARGRHQATSKYVDAFADFIRGRMLPQDQTAIFAWNRATPFTSDHARLLRVVERYRDKHEAIDTDLREWFSGLRALYGSKEIPPFIQKRIDEVFADEDVAHPIAPAIIAGQTQIDRDAQRITNDLLRAEQLAATRAAGASTLPDLAAENTAALTDLTFDQYAAQMVETVQDLGNLYAGIAYLRHLDGEKHMVVLTERGLHLPSQDGNVSLARVAADARIALDVIQTGGVVGTAPPMYGAGRGYSMSAVASANAMFGQAFAIGDLRVMTELSGGQLQAFKSGTAAFTRLADSLEFQYLLGYQPINRALDGKFRKVRVTVNRPGVLVMYRQGYFATSQLVLMDRREMITFSRIQAALATDRLIDHLRVTLGSPAVVGEGTKREWAVDVTVDISRVTFTNDGERDIAALDVELYGGDGKQQVVAELKRRVDLKYTNARRTEAAAGGGATFRLTLPYDQSIRTLKIAVYDYGADLVGTAAATVSR